MNHTTLLTFRSFTMISEKPIGQYQIKTDFVAVNEPFCISMDARSEGYCAWYRNQIFT
jgi:hypothetical protein